MQAVIEEPFATAGLIRVLRAPRGKKPRDPIRDLAEHMLGECVRPLLLAPDPSQLRARSAQILPLFAHHRAALFQLLKPQLSTPRGLRKVLDEVRDLLEKGLSAPPPCLDADGTLAFRFGIATTLRVQTRLIDRALHGLPWPVGAASGQRLEALWRLISVATLLDLLITTLGLSVLGDVPAPSREVAGALARGVHDVSLEYATRLKLFLDPPAGVSEVSTRPSDSPGEERTWSEVGLREWIRALPEG